MKPNTANEYYCVSGINLSFKLKLSDYTPPLKLIITYPETNHPSKLVQIYTSHEVKEPSLEEHTGSYVNPNLISVSQSSQDPKTGKMIFDNEWIYLTVISLNSGCKIRITPKFKEDLSSSKASAAASTRRKRERVTDMVQEATDSAADGAAEAGEYGARRSAYDNELTIQNLELGSGSMK